MRAFLIALVVFLIVCTVIVIACVLNAADYDDAWDEVHPAKGEPRDDDE